MIEDYTLSNARVTWRSADSAWQAALSVTNLTDEYYWLNVFDQFDSTAGQLGVGPGLPRMWTVSLKRDFEF